MRMQEKSLSSEMRYEQIEETKVPRYATATQSGPGAVKAPSGQGTRIRYTTTLCECLRAQSSESEARPAV